MPRLSIRVLTSLQSISSASSGPSVASMNPVTGPTRRRRRSASASMSAAPGRDRSGRSTARPASGSFGSVSGPGCGPGNATATFQRSVTVSQRDGLWTFVAVKYRPGGSGHGFGLPICPQTIFTAYWKSVRCPGLGPAPLQLQLMICSFDMRVHVRPCCRRSGAVASAARAAVAVKPADNARAIPDPLPVNCLDHGARRPCRRCAAVLRRAFRRLRCCALLRSATDDVARNSRTRPGARAPCCHLDHGRSLVRRFATH